MKHYKGSYFILQNLIKQKFNVKACDLVINYDKYAFLSLPYKKKQQGLQGLIEVNHISLIKENLYKMEKEEGDGKQKAYTY